MRPPPRGAELPADPAPPRVLRPAALSALLALAACSLTEADRGTDSRYVQTLTVDAVTAACVGEGERTCLRVKRAPEADWELFYDPIEGFTYEPGFVYVLDVEVRTAEDPPADGSGLAYRLVRVVSKTPA